MSEPKWTPGKWRVVPAGRRRDRRCIRAQDGTWLTDYICGDDVEANAHLIAAAPELFDALAEVLRKHGELDCDVCERAQKALAKARGES